MINEYYLSHYNVSLVLMPMIAFALAKIAHMEDDQTLALLLVGSCPGGTLSNIATYYAKGDLNLRQAMVQL